LRFDIAHVFRLAMLPFARHFLDGSSGAAERHLDLDDIESVTHRRLAALCRLNGESARASFFESEARRYEALEAEVLREFDRIYVCSEGDKAKLPGERRGEICVLPNAVRIPDVAAPEPGDGIFTFLFVGTLGYYPNEDAVSFLGNEIVPRIRKLTQSDFAVNLVGTGASERCVRTATACGLRMIGAVPDVAPWYQNSGAVVTPVRAGGGTRIKILEAFGHRRPVVTTSIGVEGIDARDEEHVLVGDTPEAFAEHCVRLMTDRELRDRLVENAHSLCRRSYSSEAIKRTIAALFAPPAR
jgi:glycosyltransferase involved in cell wall biosynthesis